MQKFPYIKSQKYRNLKRIYSEVSGPGGLKLAEFIAEKMDIQPNVKLLDIGTNSGYQTCFLAKEYGPIVTGIDPWGNSAEKLMKNAAQWKVENRVTAMKVGLPQTNFANSSFDRVYCTTTLEMIRGMKGEDGYKACLSEIYRILKPRGIFGMGEPMHEDVEVPTEIYPYITRGNMPAPWIDSFTTLEKTVEAFSSVGFEILEADYAPDSQEWWQEYAKYDPDPGEDAIVINKDNGRWLSFGYVIAQKQSPQ